MSVETQAELDGMLASGSGRVVDDADGWTVRTADGAPIVLTAA